MSPHDYVLIVEDDPDLAEVESMILRSAGYLSATASNGEDALRLVAMRRPALILLDMLMPVMDGWRFAEALRARYGTSIPVVVITAAEHAQQRADEIGAKEALPKPFEFESLVETVRKYVGPGVVEAPTTHA